MKSDLKFYFKAVMSFIKINVKLFFNIKIILNKCSDNDYFENTKKYVKMMKKNAMSAIITLVNNSSKLIRLKTSDTNNTKTFF